MKIFTKRFSALLFVSLILINAFSQKFFLAKVQDSAGNMLSGVTIILKSPASKDSAIGYTDANGMARLSFTPNKAILIFAVKKGFAKYADAMENDANPRFQMLTAITLSSISTDIGKVIVRGYKMTVTDDTVAYKIDSSLYKTGDNVEDMIKKLPGITVDAQGNITAQGKSVSKIKVNGKDFFGGDVKTATRELTADMIDKIEVIDDYGDQANFTGVKDGEAEKVINLRLKKDRNKGYFGKFAVGTGADLTNESNEFRYTLGGSLHRFKESKQISIMGNLNNLSQGLFDFGGRRGGGMRMMGMMMANSARGGNGMNGGDMASMNSITNSGDWGMIRSSSAGGEGITEMQALGINFRNDFAHNISFYGSYTLSFKDQSVLNNTVQQNLSDVNRFANTQNTSQSNWSNSNRFYANIEAKLDTFNYLKISTQFQLQNYDNTNTQKFSFVRNETTTTSYGINNYNSKYTTPDASINILYNHLFNKKGRFYSINYTTNNNYNIQTDRRLNNSFFNSPLDTIYISQTIDQNYNFRQHNVKISYNEPLSKKVNWELNYNYNNSYMHIDKITSVFRNKIDSLSNIYSNEFAFHRVGTNFRVVQKKYNYSIGFGVQPAQLIGISEVINKTYTTNQFNYFPAARFVYNFTKTKSLNINYTGTTNQPSYTQLQPVRDISNVQYPVQGNPNLKAEFYNNYSLRFNNFDFMRGNVIHAVISASAVSNKVVNNIVFLGNSGVQETRYLNANGFYTVTGFFMFNKSYNNRKYVLNSMTSANAGNNISYINSIENKAKNYSLSQTLRFEYNPKWAELKIGATAANNLTKNSLAAQPANNILSYTLSHEARYFINEKLFVTYDLNKTFNQGYGSINVSPFIVNIGIEKFLFKKLGSLKLNVFDLLNQQININRTVNGNIIIDSRSNRLTRYFLVTFSMRLQKFNGKEIKLEMPKPSDTPPPFMRPPGN